MNIFCLIILKKKLFIFSIVLGLKTFSDWPTYPQLYINGELTGGLDIVKELIESGEFDSMVPKKQSLDDR